MTYYCQKCGTMLKEVKTSKFVCEKCGAEYVEKLEVYSLGGKKKIDDDEENEEEEDDE